MEDTYVNTEPNRLLQNKIKNASTKKIAILGSRDILDETFRQVRAFACSIALKGHTIVTGGARGTDHAAILGALDAGSTPIAVVPITINYQPAKVRKDLERCQVKEHPWKKGKGYVAAVHDRNREIVQGADQIYVFCYPGSKGSKSYLRYARLTGKKIRVFRVPFGR